MAHASQVSRMRPPGGRHVPRPTRLLFFRVSSRCVPARGRRHGHLLQQESHSLSSWQGGHNGNRCLRSVRRAGATSRPRTLASRQACASAAKCPAQMTEVEGEDDRTVQNQSSCRRRHRCQEHGRHCRCHRLPIHNGRILTMYVNAETQSDARAEPVRPIGIAWRQHPWCLIS